MPASSPFPTYLFATAYDAMIAVLKEDELLKRAVRTWKIYNGEPGDYDPPEPSQMPWVRLTPALGQIDFSAVNEYREPFPVQVEMACEGTNVRHMLNFWGAILLALVDDKPHRDRTVRRFLQDNGVTHYKVTRPGGAPVPYSGNVGMTSQAVISLFVYVPA